MSELLCLQASFLCFRLLRLLSLYSRLLSSCFYGAFLIYVLIPLQHVVPTVNTRFFLLITQFLAATFSYWWPLLAFLDFLDLLGILISSKCPLTKNLAVLLGSMVMNFTSGNGKCGHYSNTRRFIPLSMVLQLLKMPLTKKIGKLESTLPSLFFAIL